MFYVRNIHCLSSGLCYCYFVEKGPLIIYLEGKSDYFTNRMQSGLKIISFNVNGVLNPIKRSKILSKLKKEKAQIAFLQETHESIRTCKTKKAGF